MKKVIGIIGPIGSGKDTAADYIAKKLNVPILEISGPLKAIALEREIQPTRQNLIALGTQVAAEKGSDYLATCLLEKIPVTGIMTGMRQVAQIEYLRHNSELLLIAVDASSEVRFERCRVRKKLGEEMNLVDFVQKEQKENSPPNTQRLFECMRLADISFFNEGSIQELHTWIENMVFPKFFYSE